ncbi:MAG: SDR family oxidoreductase [Armatimonadetes bacterium]|nr:SDR family oxidoreductase [Armatimonadota bacterium]
MNVLITGVEGQLGRVLLRVLRRESNWDFAGLTRTHFQTAKEAIPVDPLSKTSWRQALATVNWHPNVIINAAAMTNVDRCESNREEAWQSNAQLAETVTRIARIFDSKVIQISTDYVFDGQSGPYSETDKPNPINYYGRTKLAAENICTQSAVPLAIVRTMWLYGHTRSTKMNFVRWLCQELSEGKSVSVVSDEFGNPTLLDDLAYAIFQIIQKDICGIINVSGEERMSRLEFAHGIAEHLDLDATLISPITNAELHRIAPRPLQSGFLTIKAKSLFGLQTRPLKHGLMITKTLRRRKGSRL